MLHCSSNTESHVFFLVALQNTAESKGLTASLPLPVPPIPLQAVRHFGTQETCIPFRCTHLLSGMAQSSHPCHAHTTNNDSQKWLAAPRSLAYWAVTTKLLATLRCAWHHILPPTTSRSDEPENSPSSLGPGFT